VVEVEHPKIGRMKSLGLPVKSTGELLSIRRAAPWLGQHSAEILKDAGYPQRDIEALYAAGVLYDHYRQAPATVTAQ
jgi:crotonobetainyl-CoA:carnitine CoA-transferase CaiB-like acyl-CoA transferase